MIATCAPITHRSVAMPPSMRSRRCPKVLTSSLTVLTSFLRELIICLDLVYIFPSAYPKGINIFFIRFGIYLRVQTIQTDVYLFQDFEQQFVEIFILLHKISPLKRQRNADAFSDCFQLCLMFFADRNTDFSPFLFAFPF